MSVKIYSITTDFPNGLDNGTFITQINEDTTITTGLYSSNITGDVYTLNFIGILSPTEETALQSLVDNHKYMPQDKYKTFVYNESTKRTELKSKYTYDLVVGPENSMAFYHSIQEAIDIAESYNMPMAIILLPGMYQEDIVIKKNGIHIRGVTGRSRAQTCIMGNVLYNATEVARNNICETHIQGTLEMTGAFRNVVHLENLEISATGGVTPLVMNNSHSGSTFIIENNVRAINEDDSAPAFHCKSGGSIDGENFALIRTMNDMDTHNPTVLIDGTGATFDVRNCRIRGCFRATGNNTIRLSGDATQVITSQSPAIDITGLTGEMRLFGGNLRCMGGGNAIAGSTETNFIFADIKARDGTEFDTTFGARVRTDGIRLVCNPNAPSTMFLSNDGTYKRPSQKAYGQINYTTNVSDNNTPSTIEVDLLTTPKREFVPITGMSSSFLENITFESATGATGDLFRFGIEGQYYVNLSASVRSTSDETICITAFKKNSSILNRGAIRTTLLNNSGFTGGVDFHNISTETILNFQENDTLEALIRTPDINETGSIHISNINISTRLLDTDI